MSRALLLTLCALAFFALSANVADVVGLGGHPWYGYWDANVAMNGRPFVLSIVEPVPGGAADRAGLRNGDLVDLRMQSLDARTRIVSQPVGARPALLRVTRDGRTFAVRVIGATMWDGQTAWKLLNETLGSISSFWLLGCALLIATRPLVPRDACTLTLVLLFGTFSVLSVGSLVVPDAGLNDVLGLIACLCSAAGGALMIVLTSRYGRRSALRVLLEVTAYALTAIGLGGCLAFGIGVMTLWFDPLPYQMGDLWRVIFDVTIAAIAACAIAAVATTPSFERPRVSWLLLPLPLAFTAATLVGTLYSLVSDWHLALAITAVSQIITIVGAAFVTYALLKRRVLDFGFVVSRTIVVGIVSLIVLMAFVILESLLNTVLAGVSHSTGVVANVALALVLGVSLSYIHKRVDLFVDTIFFRKRHDDERALTDFSKEAAYVTDSTALLDQAIARIKAHTDARNATILVADRSSYVAARWYGGDAPRAIGANDGVILALKAWHKPLDPHHCDTDVAGALALPMLATGRLFGVVVLGERAGGEAYAPDEVAALAQFAHGVGTALDALASRNGDSQEAWRATVTDTLVSLNDAVRALPDAIAAKLRDGLPN